MNVDFSKLSPEERDARITSLLLGELAPEEATELRAFIAADPELARACERRERTISLLREAACRQHPAGEPSEATVAEPARLSDDRRKKLLETFQSAAPTPRVRWRLRLPTVPRWSVPMAAAAILVGLLVISVTELGNIGPWRRARERATSLTLWESGSRPYVTGSYFSDLGKSARAERREVNLPQGGSPLIAFRKLAAPAQSASPSAENLSANVGLQINGQMQPFDVNGGDVSYNVVQAGKSSRRSAIALPAIENEERGLRQLAGREKSSAFGMDFDADGSKALAVQVGDAVGRNNDFIANGFAVSNPSEVTAINGRESKQRASDSLEFRAKDDRGDAITPGALIVSERMYAAEPTAGAKPAVPQPVTAKAEPSDPIAPAQVSSHTLLGATAVNGTGLPRTDGKFPSTAPAYTYSIAPGNMAGESPAKGNALGDTQARGYGMTWGAKSDLSPLGTLAGREFDVAKPSDVDALRGASVKSEDSGTVTFSAAGQMQPEATAEYVTLHNYSAPSPVALPATAPVSAPARPARGVSVNANDPVGNLGGLQNPTPTLDAKPVVGSGGARASGDSAQVAATPSPTTGNPLTTRLRTASPLAGTEWFENSQPANSDSRQTAVGGWFMNVEQGVRGFWDDNGSRAAEDRFGTQGSGPASLGFAVEGKKVPAEAAKESGLEKVISEGFVSYVNGAQTPAPPTVNQPTPTLGIDGLSDSPGRVTADKPAARLADDDLATGAQDREWAFGNRAGFGGGGFGRGAGGGIGGAGLGARYAGVSSTPSIDLYSGLNRNGTVIYRQADGARLAGPQGNFKAPAIDLAPRDEELKDLSKTGEATERNAQVLTTDSNIDAAGLPIAPHDTAATVAMRRSLQSGKDPKASASNAEGLGELATRKAQDVDAAGLPVTLLPPQMEVSQALDLYANLAGRKLVTSPQLQTGMIAVPDLSRLSEAEKIESLGKALALNQVAMIQEGKDFVKAVPAATVAAEEPPQKKTSVPRPIPQPEVLARENAFSTFSLNVSDVSFKLAAASLEKGQMPDAANVRSEEFINAFDYRDPMPMAGTPLAFAWERARYPFAHNRDVVRFSVKTAAQGREAGKPLNIVVLLDNSGSMERADRVRIIQESLRTLATQLKPTDKISVVTFARTASLRVDGVSGTNAVDVANKVGVLTPEGGTNLEDALDLAYRTALRHYEASAVNRIVLLTDGAANLGNVDPKTLKAKVENYRKQGIALDCFGIGWEGFNDDLLEQLSRNGDGRYGFVNTPEEAASEFVGQLAGALRVAASDVKMQVEFNPKRVTAWRQIGYAKHQLTKEQFRDNKVDAAEIGAAESGNALYVIETNPNGQGPIATVRARFRVPQTSDYREHEWVVPFGSAVELQQASPALRLAASASAFSEWLAASPFGGEVSTDRLLQILSGVPENYGADPRPKKLEWMIRQAKSISGK